MEIWHTINHLRQRMRLSPNRSSRRRTHRQLILRQRNHQSSTSPVSIKSRPAMISNGSSIVPTNKVSISSFHLVGRMGTRNSRYSKYSKCSKYSRYSKFKQLQHLLRPQTSNNHLPYLLRTRNHKFLHLSNSYQKFDQ